MDAKPVNVCQLCFGINDCHHNAVVSREYQCSICIDTYPTSGEAEHCCRHLIDNSKLDTSHYAKEVKKVREPKMEYPTALLKGIDR